MAANDFELVASDTSQQNNDFAAVDNTSGPKPTTPLPMSASIMSLATAGDGTAETALALQQQNIDLVRERIAQGQEFSDRLGVAAKRQERTLKALNTLRAPKGVISKETAAEVDKGYQNIAASRIEDDARTAAEEEAIRKIQDYLHNGETTEAKLSYSLLTKGGASQRWYEEATKNLLLSQAVERYQAEANDMTWGASALSFLTSLIPTNYNFSRSGVVPGSKGNLYDFFFSGSGLARQGNDLWSKYDSKSLAAALAPGGELDASLRSNATTFGTYNPGEAGAILDSLHYQNEADRTWASIWGALDAGTVALPKIGIVPWRSLSSIPGALTRVGARSAARRSISDAFETTIREGSEAAVTRTGMDTQAVTEALEPTALNPRASTPNSVPHGTDVDSYLQAAETVLRELPENIQVSRATTPEEIQHAYEAAVKAEEKKLGKSIKDVKFMAEDVRTGEKFDLTPSDNSPDATDLWGSHEVQFREGGVKETWSYSQKPDGRLYRTKIKEDGSVVKEVMFEDADTGILWWGEEASLNGKQIQKLLTKAEAEEEILRELPKKPSKPVIKALPEQGNVVHYIEYTVGKKSGGGFASAKTAMAEATKRGLAGAAVEGVYTVGERVVTNASEGFTTRAYHGTASAFENFDNAFAGAATGAENTKGGVTFFSSDPDVALSYGRKAASAANQAEYQRLSALIKTPEATDADIDAFEAVLERIGDDAGTNIRPVDLKTDNFEIVDMKGQSYNGPTTQSILDKARADGKGGVIFKNYDDDILNGKVSDVIAVFDTSTIRPAFSQIRREVSGQWFIKGRANVAENGFRTTPLNTPANNFMSALRSDARRVDRSAQMKAVAAGQNAEKVSAALQHRMKESLKGISKNDKLFLDEIIRKGQNEARWLSEREFNTVFERAAGRLPTERVVNAYKSYRLFNDVEYILRNDELYKSLAIRGMETVDFQAGPIRINGAAQVIPDGAVPTERVFNVSDGIHYTIRNPLSADEYARLKGEGYLLVKANDAATLPDGTVVRNFLIKRGELKRSPLERTQLAYSEGGHRAYTGKYFAKQATSGVQPDTGQKFLKNPNVFRTGNNPNRLADWASTMNRAIEEARNGNLDAQWFDDNLFNNHPDLSFPSGREFVEAVDKGSIDLHNPIEIVGDRELPSAYSAARNDIDRFIDETETGATGYYRTTGRMYNSRKGEHLLDESGDFAETVDPWETMNTAMFNISRMSSLSNYKENVLERFSRTYGNHLDLRQLENASPSDLITARVRPGTPGALARQINAEQAAMKRIMNFETGFEKGIKQAHRELATWVLGDARGGARETAHDFVYWLKDNNPVQFLRSVAFDVKLGLFNFGQLALQSSTMVASLALDPRNGMKGMTSVLPLFTHTLSKGNPAVLDVLAKRSWKIGGFASEAEMKEFFRFVDRSGFMQVGNTHLLINDFGPNRVFGAASMIDGIREKGRALFYMAEQFNRGVASRIAWERLKEQGLAVGSAEFRERFIGMADDLTLNMTNESSAAFQHGLASIPTQFWAYNVRMMDAMFGDGFSKAARARLILSQFALFGAGGVPVADALFDYWKRHDRTENFDIDTFLGTLDRGAVDKAISAVYGADVRFGERVGTGAFSTDLFKDIFGLGEYGEKSPIETFGGATFSISTQIGKTMANAISYAMAESGGDQGFAATKDNILKVAMNISTLSNITKAVTAYNYGMYRSASGSVQASDLPKADAFWIALGLRPQEVEDLGLMKSYLDNKDHVIAEASKQLRDWRQEAFNNDDKFEENRQKANTFINLLPIEIRSDVVKRANSTTDKSFYEHVAQKYQREIIKEDALNNGER